MQTCRTTACAYCIVACGYKAYSWKVGEPSGGPAAADNAFGVDFPTEVLSGYWIRQQQDLRPSTHSRCYVITRYEFPKLVSISLAKPNRSILATTSRLH
ncbi:MAG: hypothetical protein GY811_25785, partial [Myxococcales bacterium]|nr:hypothetical protein [Myxococcales bacterium]